MLVVGLQGLVNLVVLRFFTRGSIFESHCLRFPKFKYLRWDEIFQGSNWCLNNLIGFV